MKNKETYPNWKWEKEDFRESESEDASSRFYYYNYTFKHSPVNQENFIPPNHPGICMGISMVHMVEQLSKSDGYINPFDDTKMLQYARIVQEDTQFQGGIPYIPTYLESQIRGNRPELQKENISFSRKKIQDQDLEVKLEKKMKKMLREQKSHGFFLSAWKNGQGHSVSMTMQNRDKEIHCTGLDSNRFFMHGKGQAACKKIAHSLYSELRKDFEPPVDCLKITLRE